MLTVVLPWFSIGTAAMSNGLARAAVAITTAHLTVAKLEHNGSALRDLPESAGTPRRDVFAHRAVPSAARHTLDHIESGSAAAALYVLMGRLAALEAASDVTDLAMKACGGAAFSRHLGLERVFRDARAGWVMAPTVDHLLEFSGRALTGLPLFG